MSERVNIINVNVAKRMTEMFGHSNIFATYLLTYLLTNTPKYRKGSASILSPASGGGRMLAFGMRVG